MKLKERLKEARKWFGMYQTELAEYLGIPYGTLKGWEQSKPDAHEWVVSLIEYKAYYGEWKIITDDTTLPDYDKAVLCYGEDHNCYIAKYTKMYGKKAFIDDYTGRIINVPIAWMHINTEIPDHTMKKIYLELDKEQVERYRNKFLVEDL